MSPSPTIPHSIKDFSILPLLLPLNPKVHYPPSTTTPPQPKHYLYLRPHSPRSPTASTPRSLFLNNIPIDSTLAHFRALFGREELGGVRVESVEFESQAARGLGGREEWVLEGFDVLRPSADDDGEGAGAGGKGRKAQGQGKKRKRAEAEIDDMALLALPEVWDRTVHESGSSAVVVFVDKTSADKAMRAVKRCIKNGTEVVWGEGVEGRVPPLGLARYEAHHRLTYPDRKTLAAKIDAFSTHFATLEEKRARVLAQQRSVPDEDGFITVTRGGRAGPARLEEAQQKAAELAEKEKKKRESMGDFYRFQAREKRKERAEELVKQFEADKRKVEELRRRRRGKF